MILGRDFFKAHKVKVDHGEDLFQIGQFKIDLSSKRKQSLEFNLIHSDTFESDASDSEESEQIPYSKTKFNEALNELAELREKLQRIDNTLKLSDSQVENKNVQSKSVKFDESADIIAENYNIIASPVVCRVSSKTVVPSKSQCLVSFQANVDSASDTMLFEPGYDKDAAPDLLIARSAHSISEPLFCNVVNVSNEPKVLESGDVIGRLSKAEIAEQEFVSKVANFERLDINTIGELVSRMKHECKLKSSIDLSSLSVGKNLSEPQIEQLRAVLWKNANAFQWKPGEIGCTNLVEHTIPTGDSKPIQQKQYPIPTVAKDFLNKQVEEMLQNKVIRPSSSPWRSPVLLVKKTLPDGTSTYRFCIDLKKVNSVTAKDSYALPIISETRDCLSGCKYCSTADLDRSFWQVGVAEQINDGSSSTSSLPHHRLRSAINFNPRSISISILIYLFYFLIF